MILKGSLKHNDRDSIIIANLYIIINNNDDVKTLIFARTIMKSIEMEEHKAETTFSRILCDLMKQGSVL